MTDPEVAVRWTVLAIGAGAVSSVLVATAGLLLALGVPGALVLVPAALLVHLGVFYAAGRAAKTVWGGLRVGLLGTATTWLMAGMPASLAFGRSSLVAAAAPASSPPMQDVLAESVIRVGLGTTTAPLVLLACGVGGAVAGGSAVDGPVDRDLPIFFGGATALLALVAGVVLPSSIGAITDNLVASVGVRGWSLEFVSIAHAGALAVVMAWQLSAVRATVQRDGLAEALLHLTPPALGSACLLWSAQSIGIGRNGLLVLGIVALAMPFLAARRPAPAHEPARSIRSWLAVTMTTAIGWAALMHVGVTTGLTATATSVMAIGPLSGEDPIPVGQAIGDALIKSAPVAPITLGTALVLATAFIAAAAWTETRERRRREADQTTTA